jgi:hypothetical protein
MLCPLLQKAAAFAALFLFVDTHIEAIVKISMSPRRTGIWFDMSHSTVGVFFLTVNRNVLSHSIPEIKVTLLIAVDIKITRCQLKK